MTVREAAIVGGYELLGQLFDGAWSTVYIARARASGERVALKKLKSVGPTALLHFKREFRAVQGIHHPNLVELRELFEHSGASFIAMELVEGRDLIAHLRAGGLDLERLRDIFRQLTLALATLHEAGVVHRDVKPSNVRVTPSGRLVLLDFGLIKTEYSEQEGIPGIGTADYMAPEQAAGSAVGAAADFYALGVCLYEALTGRRPLVAQTPLALMHAKQRVLPPPPGSQVAGLPSDLAALCMQLLAIDARERPGAAEILRVLQTHGWGRSTVQPSSAAADSFAGRESELRALFEAAAQAQRGGLRLVLIEGDSGIGKSGLVAEFARRLRAQPGDALLLRSRCYENELLAYKAFDGAMEQLARALCELPPERCAALLPERAALLPRLFGALAGVPAMVWASTRGLPAEPAAQRLAGFHALCELLARLARMRPVLLEIDDLQWADAESFRLLRALHEDPQAPALLIVATVRPQAELSDEATAALLRIRSWPCTSSLALSGLAHDEATQLAAQWLATEPDSVATQTLVRESRGHPLLLAELVRYAQSSGRQGQVVSLEESLRARITSLPAAAEQLLSAAAVAGRPYPTQVLADATELGSAELNVRASELLADRLLRRRRGHELACFHDQIRSAALQRLSPERVRDLHQRLAAALAAQPSPDAAELARHHDAGGQPLPAIEAYARAAQLALTALAFARAEQLCARALELGADTELPAALRHALELTRGHALARGGRSAEAARQYEHAARNAQGQEQTRLRIWAAQHLLQSAHVAEGMTAARALLTQLGVPVPTSAPATLVRVLWDRTVLRVQGSRISGPRAPRDPRARMQLDALWDLAMPIAWLEPLTSAALSARHMRVARALCEPAHMARALAEEAFARALRDARDPQADLLLQRARALCERGDDPALEVSVAFREATVAATRWDLRLSNERLEHAQQVAVERCPDQPWLLTNVRIALGSNWMLVVEHAALAVSSTSWLAEARDRDDRFALSLLRGLGAGACVDLMAGEPERALQALQQSLVHWPREPFAFTHYGELVATSWIQLYRGGRGLSAWLERERERLERAALLKLPFFKTTWLLVQIWACLSALCEASGPEVAQLVQKAELHLRALRKLDVRVAAIQSVAIEAQLAALAGQTDVAIGKASAARAQADGCGYRMLALGLDYLIGLLEGGEAGAARTRDALAVFAAQGWREPRRAPMLFCAAIDAIELRP